jgi:hypothetical protein
MNLRVFKLAESALMLEISSPSLRSDLKWFVPMLEADSEKLEDVSPHEQIDVEFQGKSCAVLFMLIKTIRVREGAVIGTLTLEDSINVLNNVLDRLAFDTAQGI